MNYYTLLTPIGLAKVTNAQLTSNKVEITQIVVGDANGVAYSPTGAETSIKREVWRGGVASIEIDPQNPNWIVVESVIPSNVGGFTLREVGLLDSAGDLIAIGNYPDTYKPLIADGSTMDLALRTIIEVSNASTVSLRIDPNIIVASRAYVDNRVRNAETGLAALEQRVTDEIKNVTQNVNVQAFGAIGNFNETTEAGFNNLTAIQNAANFARENDLEIYLPPGNYMVNGELTIWTSIVGEGVLYFNNANRLARLFVQPTKAAITLNPDNLTGLTKDSTLIGGLGGDYTNGTLVIESAEELSKRYLPPNNGSYLKNEVATIVDKVGRILPALDYNFDKSRITSARILPQEKRLTIGVDIKAYGSVEKDGYLIATYRGNICFDGITILSTRGAAIKNIVSVNTGTFIDFNNVKISNAQNAEEGYGVALYKSAFVTFSDCNITDCRHAISGRHAKQVLIRGGVYSDNIDSHWGSGYTIKEATILRRVLYAGKDLEIKDCTFYSTDLSVSLRYDTPQIEGDLIFENNRIVSSAAGALTLVSYTMTTYGAFDFVNMLKTPSSIIVSNNTVIADSNREVRLLNTTNSNNAIQKHENFDNVEIENNTMVNNNKTGVIMAYTPNQQTNTQDSRLRIVNQKMLGGKTSDLVNLTIRGTDARSATWKYIIDIENCNNVSVYADENTYRKLNISRSSIVFIARIFADIPIVGRAYGIFIHNCTLNNTTMTIDNLDWNISNSVIDGEFIVRDRSRQMLKSAVGTYATSTATGEGLDPSINYFSYLRTN